VPSGSTARRQERPDHSGEGRAGITPASRSPRQIGSYGRRISACKHEWRPIPARQLPRGPAVPVPAAIRGRRPRAVLPDPARHVRTGSGRTGPVLRRRGQHPVHRPQARFCFKWIDSVCQLRELRTAAERRSFLLNLICFAACIEGLFSGREVTGFHRPAATRRGPRRPGEPAAHPGARAHQRWPGASWPPPAPAPARWRWRAMPTPRPAPPSSASRWAPGRPGSGPPNWLAVPLLVRVP
jgi:hypothetical protein